MQIREALMRRAYPYYRFWYVRWSFVVTGGFLAAYLSPWAPAEWHNTPSLLWLHNIAPWWLISLLFAVYTVLLWLGGVGHVVAADFLGLFLYLCELIALIVTAEPGRWNGWVMVAFALVCVFHIAAGALSVYQRESV